MNALLQRALTLLFPALLLPESLHVHLCFCTGEEQSPVVRDCCARPEPASCCEKPASAPERHSRSCPMHHGSESVASDDASCACCRRIDSEQPDRLLTVQHAEPVPALLDAPVSFEPAAALRSALQVLRPAAPASVPRSRCLPLLI